MDRDDFDLTEQLARQEALKALLEEKEEVNRRLAAAVMELQASRAELAESEERYRTIVVENPEGIVVSREGRIIYLNAAALKLFGAGSERELIGTAIIDRIHPDNRDEVMSRVRAAAEEGRRAGSMDEKIFKLDGSVGHVRVSGARINFMGSPAALAIMQDISHEHDIEEALKETRARVENVIKCSPMGIHSYRLEADGRLVFVGANPAADRILGVDHGQFMGMTIEEAFPPLAETEIPAVYRRACATGEPWSAEQVDYAHGAIRGAYEVFAFGTSPGEMSVMFLDITARKRAEAERASLEEQLRQSQKMEAVGKLAGGIAHDFNNLLTAMIGYCDLLEMETAERRVIDNVDHIRAAAERAASLTRQLLAFSRKQVLKPKVLNPASMIFEMESMLGRLLGEEIKLEMRFAAGLGKIMADPGQLTQVVMNLALNARDAMHEGGVLTISGENFAIGELDPGRFPGAKPGDYVMLTVSDTGTGMDEEVRGRIFEPFFTTKEVGQGTGLGLATVHGIVAQSGWQIAVESAPGIGSSFYVIFPVTGEMEETEAREQGLAAPGAGTVLVVEDSDDVRLMACHALRAQGYKVLEAPTGDEALAIARGLEGGLDLLLTDVVMPGISGKALADRLMRLRPGMRVLFMSGYAEDLLGRHGVITKDVRFIQKPFRTRELIKAVAEAIGQS